MSILVTPPARERLQRLLTDAGNEWVRFGVKGGGCSGFAYTLDTAPAASATDKTFEIDGLRICVDKKSYLHVHGTTIDFEDTLVRSGFVYDNPMARRSCACGTSFAV